MHCNEMRTILIWSLIESLIPPGSNLPDSIAKYKIVITAPSCLSLIDCMDSVSWSDIAMKSWLAEVYALFLGL